MVGPTRTARDDFEQLFAEKFWDLVPETYRNEDGLAEPPGQLRALVELIAGEAAIERRSIDRLLADSRVEEADDWALAYIGQLLGTRFLNPLNSAGRRVDIARTLAYRRRAGTARLLEKLANDIAGWDAKLSEAFRRLVRFPHALDRTFEPGSVTGTLPGGWPNVRALRIGDIADGPFDDMAHRPDFRPGRGVRGLYNIPKANLFLYRTFAFPLRGIDPVRLNDRHYILDPSGRGNFTLFQPGDPERAECEAPAEWQIRMPITCRRLGSVRYCLPASAAAGGLNWGLLVGRSFDSAEDLLATAAAEGVGNLPALPMAALDPTSIKAHLIAHPGNILPAIDIAFKGNRLLPHQLAGAGLANWANGVSPPNQVEAMLDPAHGLLQLTGPPVATGVTIRLDQLYYGQYHPVGAGTYDRSGDLPATAGTALALTPNLSSISGDFEAVNSRTYRPVTASDRIDITADTRIWANNGERPYFKLRPAAGGNAIELRATSAGRVLELDGLWIGAALSGAMAGTNLARLRITGQWDRIVLRHMTLDPGGVKAALAPTADEPFAFENGRPIPHVRILIEGQVEDLIVDRSIIGSLRDTGAGLAAGLSACSAARVTIADSIVHGLGGAPAIDMPSADFAIDRCTILGSCRLGRAEISNTIIDGTLEVQDAQGSCLRFSAVAGGPRIPGPYRCVIMADGLPAGMFDSRRFGDWNYCRLSASCPEEIAEGGESGCEMGAYYRALFPIKRDDLLAKIAEFAPVQAVVQTILET
jgi:hypothetical protein